VGLTLTLPHLSSTLTLPHLPSQRISQFPDIPLRGEELSARGKELPARGQETGTPRKGKGTPSQLSPSKGKGYLSKGKGLDRRIFRSSRYFRGGRDNLPFGFAIFMV